MGECYCIHLLGNSTKMSLPLGLEESLKNLQCWCSYAFFFSSVSLDLIYSWPRLFKSWIALSTG